MAEALLCSPPPGGRFFREFSWAAASGLYCVCGAAVAVLERQLKNNAASPRVNNDTPLLMSVMRTHLYEQSEPCHPV